MAKIWVEAYGCSASFADSEMISGLIVNGGHTLVQDPSEADLNLIVTCSVKDVTATKMVHRIKQSQSKPLVVAGCLPKAERHTVEKFAENASMLGPNSIGKTLQVIETTLSGSKVVALDDTDLSKVGIPKIRLNPAVGIVEIASGCMSECTFCQTKLAKGDLKSYRIGDIVRQVKSELVDGCKEIWLSSTDNGCYGLDIETDLPSLINEVNQIPGDFRVRVGMMMGSELKGKYLGIIGLGNIGKRLGRLARALNMNIIGYDTVPIDEEFSKEVGLMKSDLNTLLASSDYVSLHVPLLDSTKHMINAEKLRLMKKTAHIVNTSRGGVIDEEALYNALKDGNLEGAALDVFEVEPATGNKLTNLPNFVATPHIGAQTKEAQSLAANVIAEKIIQILRGVI